MILRCKFLSRLHWISHFELISHMTGHIMHAIRLFLATTVLALSPYATAQVVYLPDFPENKQSSQRNVSQSSDALQIAASE